MMQELDSGNVMIEYTFTGLTGNEYHPFIKDGKWYVSPMAGPVSFFDVVYLCKIPDEEALMMRLKYGG